LRCNERRHHLVGAGSEEDHNRQHQQRGNGVAPGRDALIPRSADQQLGVLLNTASPFGIRRTNPLLGLLTNRLIFIYLNDRGG